jgi:hypothetical protein
MREIIFLNLFYLVITMHKGLVRTRSCVQHTAGADNNWDYVRVMRCHTDLNWNRTTDTKTFLPQY